MMRSLQSINFVERRPALRRVWYFVAFGTAALSCGAIAWALHMRQMRLDASATWQRALERQREQDEQQVQLQARAVLIAEHLHTLDQAARPWMSGRRFPWDESLLSLERVDVSGFRLLRVTANPDAKRVQIDLDAETPDTVLQVVQRLNGDADGRGAVTWRIERLQQRSSLPHAFPINAALAGEMVR